MCRGKPTRRTGASSQPSRTVFVPWRGSVSVELEGLIQPEWKPLRHIRRGWMALNLAERTEVKQRVEAVLAQHTYGPDCRPDALAHFFAFLAQVETIAIEIPLRFMDVAPEPVRPLLRRQLVDEVFHSTLFARLAHELSPTGRPGAPLPSAERLLDRIRSEQDLSISATLLNLVAEGWIENLFKHALRWGVADAVFEAVLADESRHVHEAEAYLTDLDPSRAAGAVHALEQGLMEVSAEASVGLSMLDLAGEEGYRALVRDLWDGHREHLAMAGLEPSQAWQDIEDLARTVTENAPSPGPKPEVEPDTPWRKAARRVWDTPRDPTMQGDLDVPVGHIPKRLLTPVLIAAAGRAWANNPRLNRIVQRDRVHRLPQVNVGVRVLVADDELATVVITHADQRSINDIRRMLIDGVKQLEAARQHRIESGAPAAEPVPDDVMAMAPVTAESFSVAISNPGKFGLVAGAGSFSGAIAPSTDISVGQRRRMPVWKGIGYVPAWHVNLGCLQDHRLFDGKEAGTAMNGLREALSKKAVREILRRPDTLDDVTAEPDYSNFMAFMPASMRALPAVGVVKWWPIVVGGAGIAAAGVGGFFLYTHLAAAAAMAAAAGSEDGQQQQQQVTIIEGSVDEHGNVVEDGGPVIDPLMEDGRPRCRAILGSGQQCAAAATEGRRCGRHPEAPLPADGRPATSGSGGQGPGGGASAVTTGAVGPKPGQPRTGKAGPGNPGARSGEGARARGPRSFEATVSDGRPRCQALKVDGEQCRLVASHGAFCGRHR